MDNMPDIQKMPVSDEKRTPLPVNYLKILTVARCLPMRRRGHHVLTMKKKADNEKIPAKNKRR